MLCLVPTNRSNNHRPNRRTRTNTDPHNLLGLKTILAHGERSSLESQPFLQKEKSRMRVFRFLPDFLLLVTVGGFGRFAAGQFASTKPAPGFSLDNIDKSIDPCVDFYQYAGGNWIKNSEIPADQAQWVSFVELHERNLDIEREILEKASAGGASRNAVDQRIGDLYGSCMDEKAVNERGMTPLKPELDRLAAVKDKSAFIDELAHLHLVSGNSLFSFYSASDLHNADQVIAYIDQGGLSLPDRDYYIEDDAKM